MTTTTLTPSSNTGRVEVAGAAPYDWEEGALPQTQTKFYEVGLTFDFGYSYSDDGLILAPRLPYSLPADALRSAAAEPWTLTLETSLTAKSTVLNLFYVLDPQPWTGTTNTPYLNRTGNAADESIRIEQITGTSDAWVLNDNGSTYDLVWDFDLRMTAEGYLGSYSNTALTNASQTYPFWDLIRSSTWNGTFQFHLFAGGAVSCTINAATFAGPVMDFHTGFLGVPMDLRSRAVHDYVTGRPYMSHLAVEDGYRDGIMVHPDSFDPEDPLDTDYYTPPPGEGVVDDEILDVE